MENDKVKHGFTFHYGQIYYTNSAKCMETEYMIYIPLWLDLLSEKNKLEFSFSAHLHSTMVRFIMNWNAFNSNASRTIYIPLWLDLLSFFSVSISFCFLNLHSTMVRFIISCKLRNRIFSQTFTFHYGQIYYKICIDFAIGRNFIYIPLWLDLLSRGIFT